MSNQNKQTLYWTRFIFGSWDLSIASTQKGLCYVGVPDSGESTDALSAWGEKHRFERIVRDDVKLRPYVEALVEYLRGKRRIFDGPIDLHGTTFQRSVWDALREIPFGTTQSYSDIAHRIQNPKAVRAVGGAIGANPLLIVVPCHRVIGKNGDLTGFREGLSMKVRLLQLEGVYPSDATVPDKHSSGLLT